jgi:hypothetical protein
MPAAVTWLRIKFASVRSTGTRRTRASFFQPEPSDLLKRGWKIVAQARINFTVNMHSRLSQPGRRSPVTVRARAMPVLTRYPHCTRTMPAQTPRARFIELRTALAARKAIGTGMIGSGRRLGTRANMPTDDRTACIGCLRVSRPVRGKPKLSYVSPYDRGSPLFLYPQGR